MLWAPDNSGEETFLHSLFIYQMFIECPLCAMNKEIEIMPLRSSGSYVSWEKVYTPW